MTEGATGGPDGQDKGPEAGGLPPQVVPTQKRFFLIEYSDEVRKGLRWLRASPKPVEGTLTKVKAGVRAWWRGKKARFGIVAVVAIVVVSWGLFSAQASSTSVFHGTAPVGPGETGHNWTATFTGTVQEQGTSPVNVTMNATKLSALTVTLTWKDESVPAYQRNQPDSLGFNVTAPNGKNWTAAMATSGSVTWKLDDTATVYGAGPWVITVQGGTMGDIQPVSGRPCIAGFLCQPDTSNAWNLKVESAW
jgi:hypothetical protein